jgi:glucokinase
MNSKILVGVDLGGTTMRAGRVDAGVLVDHVARPTPAKASAERVEEELARTIAQVFTRDTVGIGVGVPSVVDVDSGVVYAVENISSWKEVPLKEILQKRFGVPVYVNNDANVFALGEYHFREGRGIRHMIGMVVGTGLGAGVIINGQLYAGANCGAGELGAIPYRDRTFEYYASGQRFQREHGESGAVLHARAQRGDTEALNIFSAFGLDFGQVMLATLYAYDPEVIVLGGSVSKAFPFFEASMRKVMAQFAYKHALDRLQIRVSERSDIAILGAAALCVMNVGQGHSGP